MKRRYFVLARLLCHHAWRNIIAMRAAMAELLRYSFNDRRSYALQLFVTGMELR